MIRYSGKPESALAKYITKTAAFAGKSYCLLGSMLPIIHHPGTRAICIRKTTKQLSGSGGLFDAAINLYSKVDPKIKVKMRDLTIVFSSGAELQFTYLDKPSDRLNLQGKLCPL